MEILLLVIWYYIRLFYYEQIKNWFYSQIYFTGFIFVFYQCFHRICIVQKVIVELITAFDCVVKIKTLQK